MQTRNANMSESKPTTKTPSSEDKDNNNNNNNDSYSRLTDDSFFPLVAFEDIDGLLAETRVMAYPHTTVKQLRNNVLASQLRYAPNNIIEGPMRLYVLHEFWPEDDDERTLSDLGVSKTTTIVLNYPIDNFYRRKGHDIGPG